ncbi:5'-methylthioadenosine/adenosylhomocysteine nucleosidase [Treponema pedis]|uniref:5'-methylthioadenosine/adenosylhomocysteine nucleosidase n=1 Tax=Treponema pedis TaxID=409322 RepID=UPI0003F8AFCA|nr:5'-methylthioadenosine/adenosylhomocysteine nucleosidase [Treponema pedis]
MIGTKTIGIFGAEQQEIKLLKRYLNGGSVKIAGINFYEGIINGQKIVLACSGIGKVNAAMCCQILISEFKVNLIINTGTAGGLKEGLNVFDIVVSSDAVQYDVNATDFGYSLGQVPGTKSAYWISDKGLKNLAVKAFKKLKLENKDFKNIKSVEGRIASGDTFVSDKKLRANIIKNFSPACTEMEGAAAAQVCVLNKIPFLILRSISDNAGKQTAAKISYDEFSKQAARNSAQLVLEMIRQV